MRILNTILNQFKNNKQIMKHFPTDPESQELLKVQFYYLSKETTEELPAMEIYFLQTHPANKTPKWLNLETTQYQPPVIRSGPFKGLCGAMKTHLD